MIYYSYLNLMMLIIKAIVDKQMDRKSFNIGIGDILTTDNSPK